GAFCFSQHSGRNSQPFHRQEHFYICDRRQELAALQISRNSARSSSRRSDTTTSLKEGFMERARLLQNGATTEESGALLVAGDYSPHAFSQGDGAAIQTDSSKIRPHAHASQEHRPARFGLPCANCKAYYDCELHACPICKCAERVPAV